MITRFSQFVGNERTVDAVQTMLAEGRLPQTLVIEGPKGSGRKTLARLLTAGLMCNNQTPPCGECTSCGLVFGGSHEDVVYLTLLKDKANIGVDQIRELRMQAHIRPGQGNRKVFVVCDKMNDAAQNAFLKILEEPPAGVYFMILCGHRSELIDTVLSRAVVFPLGTVSYEQAKPLLAARGIIPSVSESWNGLLGDLLTDDTLDSPLQQAVCQCCAALANRAPQDFLRGVALVAEQRVLYPGLLDGIYTLLRDALVCQSGKPVADPNASLLARRFTKERLLALSEMIHQQRNNLPYNPNGWLFFTALCARLFPKG